MKTGFALRGAGRSGTGCSDSVMPDVLLIQPPIRDFYLTEKRTVPYGLTCIASALVREGFTVSILDALANRRARRIDLPPEMQYLREIYAGPDISPFALFRDFKHFGLGFEEIGELAAESGAFLIGISSLFTAYSNEAIQTAQSVRRHCPKTAIVLGGHHPTEMPAEVLSHECVDFIIRGEGEAALPLLARAIRNGAAPGSIPGIAYRRDPQLLSREGPPEGMEDVSAPGASRNGRILSSAEIHLNPPVIIDNVDNLPPPAIGMIDASFYQRKKKPCAVVVASRGCPLKCTYCSIGGASWSRFRLKSISAVMMELDQAVFLAGARFIDFEDENISFDRNWFLSLLHAIMKRYSGLGIEFRAMNGLFSPTLDDEVIEAMKGAGFTALNLSLCTTCREQLDRFRRPDVRASFERAVSAAQKQGLETIGYIIVGAPGQNGRDSVADLLYLATQNVIAGVSVYYPAPR